MVYTVRTHVFKNIYISMLLKLQLYNIKYIQSIQWYTTHTYLHLAVKNSPLFHEALPVPGSLNLHHARSNNK